MTPRRRLERLHRSTARYLLRLRGSIPTFGSVRAGRESDVRVSYATINLLNCWANFVRNYYLSCALGTRTKGAVPVHCAIRFATVNDALGRAIQKFRPSATPKTSGEWDRRDEPAWHDSNTLLRLAEDPGLSNRYSIEAALSLGSRVFIDLPTMRNYFAHRNQSTYRAAVSIGANYGIPVRDRHPIEILLSRPLRRPQLLLYDWIDDIQTTVELLCE